MRKYQIIALGAFVGLVLNARQTPSLGTATFGMLLALVFAGALIPLVKEGLDALVD